MAPAPSASLGASGYVLTVDRILLTVPAGHRSDGIVSLVLGGLGSRVDLPVDRVEELALATSTVGASALADELVLEAQVLDDRVLLRLGPLEAGTSTDMARRRLIEPLVDGVAAIRRDGSEWLELELRRDVTG